MAELQAAQLSTRLLLKKDKQKEFKKEQEQILMRSSRRHSGRNNFQNYMPASVPQEEDSSKSVDSPTNKKMLDRILKKSHWRKKTDVLDLSLDRGIQLKLAGQIRDSEYIVQMCQNSNNPYLNFKRSNILKNKAKEHKQVLESIRLSIRLKKKERGDKEETASEDSKSLSAKPNPIIQLQDTESLGSDMVNNEASYEKASHSFGETKYFKDNTIHTIIESESPPPQQLATFDQEMLARPKTNIVGNLRQIRTKRIKNIASSRDDNCEDYVEKKPLAKNYVLIEDCLTSATNPSNVRTMTQQNKKRQFTSRSGYQTADRVSSFRNNPSVNNFNHQGTSQYQTLYSKAQPRSVGSSLLRQKKLSKYQSLRQDTVTRIQEKQNVQEQLVKLKQDHNSKYSYDFPECPKPFSKPSTSFGGRRRKSTEFSKRKESSEVAASINNQLLKIQENCANQINQQPDYAKISKIYDRLALEDFSNSSHIDYLSQLVQDIPNRQLIPKYLLENLKGERNAFRGTVNLGAKGHITRQSESLQQQSRAEESEDVLKHVPFPQKVGQYVQQEELKLNSFKQTLDTMLRMEATERPQTMQRIFDYEQEQNRELFLESQIIKEEYRKGLSDPARFAAQWERNKGVRKMVGKKTIVDQFMKRLDQLQQINTG